MLALGELAACRREHATPKPAPAVSSVAVVTTVPERCDARADCASFARGAWWIDTATTARETVRASVDGRAYGPWSPSGTGIDVSGAKSLTTMLVSDYDGDGIPELYVRTDEEGVEGGHDTESWVLTLRDGAIREYAPAKGFGTIDTPVDDDDDGLVDLPVSLGVHWIERQCMRKPELHPASFLAHALPDGKFSTTDAVATRHLNGWCPGMPGRIATAEDALCARLRTKPADRAKVRARIAAKCVPWDCAAELEGNPQKDGADHACNDMLDTFDQETTLSL